MSVRVGAAGVVLSLAIAGATAAPSHADSRPYCQYPQHYNTILCPRSKTEADAYCANASAYSAPNSPVVMHHERIVGGGAPGKPVQRYEDGSTSRYRVMFFASDIKGCQLAGTRRISYLQERRLGSSAYAASSRTITITTDNSYSADVVLKAPYDCSVMPGGEVRLVVRITWLPASGWGGHPTTRTFAGKPSRVC